MVDEENILDCLLSIKKLLVDILNELKSKEDKGETYYLSGTATTSIIAANIIDVPAVLGMPERKVKGYIIKNDGANNLRVGHNVTRGIIDTGLDVAMSRSKFYSVFPGEDIKITYNKEVIENVYVFASAGTSVFRLWLLW